MSAAAPVFPSPENCPSSQSCVHRYFLSWRWTVQAFSSYSPWGLQKVCNQMWSIIFWKGRLQFPVQAWSY